MLVQAVLFDDGSRPYRIEQRLLRQKVSTVLDQKGQRVEDPRFQVNRAPVRRGQASRGDVQSKPLSER